MRSRQALALQNPCTSAEQTIARMFHSVQKVGRLWLSSVLTVNK